MSKQVIYFYEGETELKLLKILKNTSRIKPGKLKKFSLWKGCFRKIQRTVNKTDELFFVVDTDDIKSITIFKENIRLLRPFNICLIVQCKNFEDELSYACEKSNAQQLFKDFYKTSGKNDFKSKFIKESSIENKLENNNFNFNKLWVKNENFNNFLSKNHISINTNCDYKL